MTDTDRLRLARLVQFRELITLIFRDPTPWGESLPVQVLADFLEAEGAHDVADAVRGRFRPENWGEWQVVHMTGRTEHFYPTVTYQKYEQGCAEIEVTLKAGISRESGDYKRKERPKD